MWEKLRVIFTIPELRNKILLTLLLLAIYRIGWQISLPIIDQAKVAATASGSQEGFGKIVEYAAVFSASNLRQATIFGLGIMPYISASIIFQLLGSVWKPIEDLQKEGEAGRKKINEWTRYATVILCLVQSTAYVRMYIMAGDSGGLVRESFLNDAGVLSFSWQITAILTMTCGTIFLMWLGEQIDEFGIGNGISLLIMAGILARMPGGGTQAAQECQVPIGRQYRWHLHRNADHSGVDVRRSRGGRGLHHAGPTTNSYTKRQTCSRSPRVWRWQAVFAASHQPVGGNADHFCQQLADVPADDLWLPVATESKASCRSIRCSAIPPRLSTTCCTSP